MSLNLRPLRDILYCPSLKIQSNMMLSTISAQGFFFFICRKYLCKSWEGKERARKKEWDMIFYHTEAHFTWQIKKKKNKTLKSATHGVKSMAAHFRCFRPSSAGCARRRSSRSVCAAGSLIAVSCWLGENQPPDCIVFMIAAIWAGFCVGVMRL